MTDDNKTETTDEKVQRLVNLVKQKNQMAKEEKKRRSVYTDDLKDVEDAINGLATELDVAEKES